jgi:Cu2+-exporting ATPase
VRIDAGAEIPVDGIVRAGECWLRREWLTGESAPIAIAVGDEVLAGSICVDASLQVRATAVGDERRRERLRLRMLEARRERPALVRFGDRCAQALLPLALFAAALAAWFGYADGGIGSAVSRAMSTLVVACPCAMGIAAPLAYWIAWAAPARRGVWLAGPEVLERLAQAQHVVFDKTGTLTAQVAIADIVYADASHALELHALIAGMQRGSRHPHAPILSSLSSTPREVDALRVVPARGQQAQHAGRTLRLGRASWLRELGVAVPCEDDRVHFAIDTQWQLAIELREALRLGAGPALRGLTDLGVASHLASGDHQARVATLQEQLPFATASGALDPEQKLKRIRALHSENVVMVGDGLNDALALAGASVGIALGAAADLSRQAAHVQSAGENPAVVPALIRFARRTRGIVLQNFAWAVAFNAVALTLGVLGKLHPIAAAFAMLGSSLIVLANSRRVGELPRLPQADAA